MWHHSHTDSTHEGVFTSDYPGAMSSCPFYIRQCHVFASLYALMRLSRLFILCMCTAKLCKRGCSLCGVLSSHQEMSYHKDNCRSTVKVWSITWHSLCYHKELSRLGSLRGTPHATIKTIDEELLRFGRLFGTPRAIIKTIDEELYRFGRLRGTPHAVLLHVGTNSLANYFYVDGPELLKAFHTPPIPCPQ